MSSILQSLSDAAASLETKEEYARRYSVPNKRGGDVKFVCTNGILYFPWYPLSKLKSPYITERLDNPHIDVPGTVHALGILLSWIDSSEQTQYHSPASFHLASVFGLSRYCTQVFDSLMCHHLHNTIPSYAITAYHTNSINIRPVSIHYMINHMWKHGHECENIAAVALRALETLIPANTMQHHFPAVQEWINYRRGTSVLERPTDHSPEERPAKRAKSE